MLSDPNIRSKSQPSLSIPFTGFSLLWDLLFSILRSHLLSAHFTCIYTSICNWWSYHIYLSYKWRQQSQIQKLNKISFLNWDLSYSLHICPTACFKQWIFFLFKYPGHANCCLILKHCFFILTSLKPARICNGIIDNIFFHS